MPTCKVQLTNRRDIANGTMAFYFEKPKGFTHTAGQFCDFTLIDPPETDQEGNTRAFTLASAPYEDSLMIATRMRDTAFKRTLRTMELGTEVSLDGPHGSFTLHSDASIPAVFLSGGIGVTPVRSIILQATHNKLPNPIVLFNGNRRPEDSAFLDVFAEAQKDNPNVTLVNTMSDMEHSNTQWNGETGFITAAMVAKTITNISGSIFYISGPQAMVAAMRKMLDESGVKDHMIRTEEFSGY